ncbi:MAG: Ribosomal-protein-alanine acetyltransferase [Cellvibrionales bacterium UBA7375]|nr:MAG: Ribosomal-protein-alanine acetyltransferase [Cellvibrionales bacterium UBA7375]
MSHSFALDFSDANKLLVDLQDHYIRPANSKDLPQISAIEQLTSAYPCSNKQLQNCIHQTYVLCQDDAIQGFTVIVTVKNQAELHTIAIKPEAQGKGLGSLFLQALIQALPTIIEQFYLEVRVSNYRAIRLYHRLGFIKIAERKDYYRHGLGREDAVVMARIRR